VELPASAREERRIFRSWTPHIFLVAWLAGWGAVVLYAASADLVAAVLLAVFWVAALVALLRFPYQAVVYPDGLITFRALTRSRTTAVRAVQRVTTNRLDGTRVFHYEGGNAGLSAGAGMRLARFLHELNPSLQDD
jgi:hypothetical protein